MSHIFISYSHADKDKLNLLVEKLKQGGFTDDEIWYDKHIKPGGDWRDEIEEKLKEAFAVAVIVTAESMNSTYVTYEWSWALGNGIPVVPLLFEDMLLTKIHSRLSKIQYINCIEEIGENVLEILRQTHRIPPDTRYLNQLIREQITPFRILARTALWLFQYGEQGLVDADRVKFMLDKSIDESKKLSKTLPEFMVEKAYAFSAKQRQICRNLIVKLDGFQMMFYPKGRGAIEIFPHPNGVKRAEEYRKKDIEPLIEQFPSDIPKKYYFKDFDNFLEKLPKDDFSRQKIQVFIEDYLSDEDAKFILMVIDSIPKEYS